MRKAVHFGAGNIGRGFIGLLLSLSGFEVVFIDIDEKLVSLLNRKKSYTVRLVGEKTEEITVRDFRAINSRDEAKVVEEIRNAVIVTTAVGPDNLKLVAPLIAKALQKQAELKVEQPLNIIACENILDNSKILKEHVKSYLPKNYINYVETHVGFPNALVDRIVPTVEDEQLLTRDPLLVVVEEYHEFIVDESGFVGERPSLHGVTFSDNLEAYIERKFFTLNTGHAITAYLGYLKGYKFIHEAIKDVQIHKIVSGALQESGSSLVKKYGFRSEQHKRYIKRILKRFENPYLRDPVVRVGRDPKRKLAPNDRLIKPAKMALQYGITPNNLALGIAAALLYDYPEDAQALELFESLKSKGVDKVLEEICGLELSSELAKMIKENLEAIKRTL